MGGKAIPLTGLWGPFGCETSRLPHSLDSQLTDGSEDVSVTRWPPFNPRKIPGTHLNWHQGHSAAGRITSNEKSSDIKNRTCDLACNNVPQSTSYCKPPGNSSTTVYCDPLSYWNRLCMIYFATYFNFFLNMCMLFL
jgi:hypothetical protein